MQHSEPLIRPLSLAAEAQAVILAHGDYPTHPVPLGILRAATCLVCTDGAANACLAEGRVPQAIVGDIDSLFPEYRDRYARLVQQESEQESNDLTKAVRFLQRQGLTRIAVLGATGKREDHTLANISLLISYLRQGVQAAAYTDHAVILPCQGSRSFACRPGQQVSVISLGAKGMRGEGLAYPLRDFTEWWQGTLNQCTDTVFTVRAEGDYLVFLNY